MPKSALFDIAQQHSLVISIGVARVSVSTHVCARVQSSWNRVAMVTVAAWPAELSRLRFAFLYHQIQNLRIRTRGESQKVTCKGYCPSAAHYPPMASKK